MTRSLATGPTRARGVRRVDARRGRVPLPRRGIAMPPTEPRLVCTSHSSRMPNREPGAKFSSSAAPSSPGARGSRPPAPFDAMRILDLETRRGVDSAAPWADPSLQRRRTGRAACPGGRGSSSGAPPSSMRRDPSWFTWLATIWPRAHAVLAHVRAVARPRRREQPRGLVVRRAALPRIDAAVRGRGHLRPRRAPPLRDPRAPVARPLVDEVASVHERLSERWGWSPLSRSVSSRPGCSDGRSRPSARRTRATARRPARAGRLPPATRSSRSRRPRSTGSRGLDYGRAAGSRRASELLGQLPGSPRRGRRAPRVPARPAPARRDPTPRSAAAPDGLAGRGPGAARARGGVRRAPPARLGVAREPGDVVPERGPWARRLRRLLARPSISGTGAASPGRWPRSSSSSPRSAPSSTRSRSSPGSTASSRGRRTTASTRRTSSWSRCSCCSGSGDGWSGGPPRS